MKRARGPVLLFLSILILFLLHIANLGPPGSVAVAQSDPSGNGKVLRSGVMSAAGSPATSRNYRGNGTLGQPTPIGVVQDTDRILCAGFWYGRLRFLDPSGAGEVPGLVNRLLKNTPNPFNPQTVIRFVAAAEGTAVVEVFDLRGTRVRTLLSGPVPAGNHAVVWDGTDDAGRTVSSGTYFYRLRIGNFEASDKMLLLK